MQHKVALVIGASGLVGSAVVRLLSGRPDWRVIGVSRTKPDLGVPFQYLLFDLLDPATCRTALATCPEVTHVFVASRVKDASFEELEEKNVEILRNLLDALEATAPRLEHVHLVHGTKWYGAHLGPTHVPAREDDPRQMPPNPYYAQYDYMTERQKGKRWTWSSVRSGVIQGYSIGYPHNIVGVLGAYAAISRELKNPLRFPGTSFCYNLVQSAVDAGLLAKAMLWVSTHPAGANEAFNVSNGDLFSWSNLWPRIAKTFGMEPGHVQPLTLAHIMSDKERVWKEIVRKHGLRNLRLKDFASWDYGDYHFNKTRSDIPSIYKLWNTGFHEFADSEEVFLSILQKYRDERIIP